MTASTKYSSQHQLDFSKRVQISEAGGEPPRLSAIVMNAPAGKDQKFQTSVEKAQKRVTFAPPPGAPGDAPADAKTLYSTAMSLLFTHLLEFQKDHEDTHGLTPTGELDGPTSGALEEIYGS
jgi:hypothetical protein